MHVAKAMAKTPQSHLISLISLEITDCAKLFNKLTCPGTHPIELKQTQ